MQDYGRTFTQWELRGYDVQQLRPGVSPEFLRAQNIRHVDIEEAELLLGLRPSSGGLWIPYSNPHNPGGPLIVNGRPFGRLRLDKPSKAAKYLSPEKSGAQLYVPAHGPPLPFGKTLVVVEGEFKAGALHEAGVKAVGIGGFSSAMANGQFIPGLAKALAKWPPETLYFVGDNDTALKFAFSYEATKLRKLLPETCRLLLPRIPLSMPKGIDDCREAEGSRFAAFWEEIKAAAIEVPRKADASALAVKLLTRELPTIKNAPDWQESYRPGIIALAARLDPLPLDDLAAAVKHHLGIKASVFKEQAKARAHRRRRAPTKSGKRRPRRRKIASSCRPDRSESMRRPKRSSGSSRRASKSSCAAAAYSICLATRTKAVY